MKGLSEGAVLQLNKSYVIIFVKLRRGAMIKKLVCLTAFILFASWVISSAFGQQEASDPRLRLKSLRYQEAALTSEYRAQTEKVNRAADDKLAALKADFHKAREECLREKKEKCDKLRADYNDSISPIRREARQLEAIVTPGKGTNFAKTREERQRTP